MAFSVRQSRTLKAYCCLRGLENEVTSDFCLAPFLIWNFVKALIALSYLKLVVKTINELLFDIF